MKKICPLAVRLTPEDRQTIEQLSLKEGKGASSWMRDVVIRHLIKIGKKKKTNSIVREYRR